MSIGFEMRLPCYLLDLIMGARLRVFLTRKEDQTLFKLRNADIPQKVKDRAEAIRLNAHGWYTELKLGEKEETTVQNL